jgi:hypothetical protein
MAFSNSFLAGSLENKLIMKWEDFLFGNSFARLYPYGGIFTCQNLPGTHKARIVLLGHTHTSFSRWFFFSFFFCSQIILILYPRGKLRSYTLEGGRELARRSGKGATFSLCIR